MWIIRQNCSNSKFKIQFKFKMDKFKIQNWADAIEEDAAGILHELVFLNFEFINFEFIKV